MKLQTLFAKTMMRVVLISMACLTGTQNVFALSFSDDFNSGIDPFWWTTVAEGGLKCFGNQSAC